MVIAKRRTRLCRVARWWPVLSIIALLGAASAFAVSPVTPSSPASGQRLDSLDLGDQVVLELARVKAGSFSMGSPGNEPGRKADEEKHQVEIPADFYIGKYPVTRGQFAKFVQETGYRTEAEKGVSGGFGFDGQSLVQRKEFNWRNPGFPQTDNHPVVLVTYNDAQAFTSWLSRKTGYTVTLPSESQWEYACRAGTSTRYYIDGSPVRIGWSKVNSENSTHPVGEKAANTWGIYDMSGNVFEWCEDLYGPYSAQGPVEGSLDKPRRVLRGGSWFKGPNDLRCAARNRNTPGSRNADNGFRVVVSADHAARPVDQTNSNSDSSRNRASLNHTSSNDDPSSPDSASSSSHAARTSSSSASSIIGKISAFSSMIFCGGALIVIAVVVIFIKVVIGFFRRSDSSYSGRRYIRPTVMDDGFWLDTSSYHPGDIVHYRYRGPSGYVDYDCVVEPGADGRQFIYTGSRPEELECNYPVSSDTSYNNSVSNSYDSSSVTRCEADDSFSGFPSAY